ncbi:MAG: M20/M25/M40 family metallo-hydrolase [Pseudomonadales bacterium]
MSVTTGAPKMRHTEIRQTQSHRRLPAWIRSAGLATLILVGSGTAGGPSAHASAPGVNDPGFDSETLEHFQALLRMDTTDPPGRELEAAEYLAKVLREEGIETQVVALEAHRPNVIARLRGNGSKRPLLLMAHTDTVNIDPAKWSFPPFSAAREGGYIYGRGTVDDKDNVTAALMTMLALKRADTPLDRDVIFLAESGEEGTTRVGIQYVVDHHFDKIDAEYCLAEGGGVTRENGRVTSVSIQTMEKSPRAIELVARGPAGHGSVPLEDNAVVHLSSAVARIAAWRTPIRLNETTRTYFERLAAIAPPEQAQYYRDILHPDSDVQARADAWFRSREPRHASVIRSSISPTMINGGYRVNVIPSEARATLDTRLEPSEDQEAFLEQVRGIVDDPSIEVNWAPRDLRPRGSSSIATEAFATLETVFDRHYAAPTLPTMSTGATDMAYLRARGIQCYGIGPAIDVEDGAKGFGAHSDQERILESELYRFTRFHLDAVRELAATKHTD